MTSRSTASRHTRPLTVLTKPEHISEAGRELEEQTMLIKIDAIVREEKFEDVKDALNKIEVNGITVSQVMGCGAQRGYKEVVRGSKVDVVLQPKVKFEIVVSSEEWEKKVIDAIQKAAYTGDMGDGKIFSYEIKDAMKIRTKETGYDALQSQLD